MASNREWTTIEVATLRHGYERGLSAQCIGDMLGRTKGSVHRMASKLGIRSARSDPRVAVEAFLKQQGKPLSEVIDWYQSRALARCDLAADIGIDGATLKRFIPPDVWQSWPHYTIGRQLAAEQRRA
ncbi:hypothetical protein [Halomonas sp. hl-4]|uniref:hypothetical protein n=1 Tax=Halomonas sp. hl-4 TaxID=1761789 RepID=UPI000BB9BD04|nr:hypothetical protein [Halomonas sp. hl-4]SNY95522.1 hypothetical protein SAMN04488142_0022 [Halomonas sp. hl-4]